MPITTSYSDLIANALDQIETVPVEAALDLIHDEGTVFVDLRDRRELEREGKIPGAFHCPRGMLEFWIDPASPYHKEIFAQGKHYLFYCASAWRSALATQAAQQMGLAPVSHIEGGFSAWKAARGAVETLD